MSSFSMADSPLPIPSGTPRRRGVQPRAPGPALLSGPDAGVYALVPSALWKALRAEPASFWFISAYLFFEYVRPQSIYSSMSGMPWAQLCLVGAVIAFVAEGRSVRFHTSADWLLAAYSLVLLASSVTAVFPADSRAKFALYFSWVLVYFLITSIADTERRAFLFLMGWVLYSFKMSQHGARSWAEAGFAFRGWGTTGAPGWFQNSGEFGIQMAMFLPVVLYLMATLRRHWGKWKQLLFATMAGSAVVSIVGSSSRGALVAMGVVVLAMALRTRFRFRALLAAVLLAVAVVTLIPPESKERFDRMGEDRTSESRKTYWRHGREIMADYPVLGIGYENWASYYQQRYDDRALPHNIFVQAGAELGYTGLALFVAMIGSTFAVNRRTRKLAAGIPGDPGVLRAMANGLDAALIGYLVGGFFVTVLYYPFFWINLAMTVAVHNAALGKRAALRPAGPARRRGSREERLRASV